MFTPFHPLHIKTRGRVIPQHSPLTIHHSPFNEAGTIITNVDNSYPQMAQYFLNPYAIPYFLSFLVSLSIASLLILKKRQNRHVQLFIITQILLAVLTFSAGMATSSSDVGVWDIWNSILTVAVVFAVTAYYHFSYVSFTKKQLFENKNVLIIYILPVFFLLFIIFNPENIIVESPDTDLGIYGKEFTGPYSFFKPLFYLIIALMLILTTVNFYKLFRMSKKRTPRRQASYFIFSSFIPLIGFLISVSSLILHIFIFHSINWFFDQRNISRNPTNNSSYTIWSGSAINIRSGSCLWHPEISTI
jgi:hypothetical protein